MNVKPRSVVEKLRGFIPSLPEKPVPELRAILGRQDIVKLSFNESPYGASPLAVEAIRQAAAEVYRYHDSDGKAVRNKLAAHYGVASEEIYLSSGADEAVSLLMHGFLNPGEEVIMQNPTFGQYAGATLLAGGIPVKVPVRSDLHTDLTAMLAAITPATKMIFVCNPNNPTGLAVGADELRGFLARVPEHIMVVLDEAYAEFVSQSDYLSGIALLGEFSNLVVLRTFSKVYGLAGLRLGYGIACPEIIAVVNRVRNAFNVNCLALVAAEAALSDTGFQRNAVENNRQQRGRLAHALAGFGFIVYPSETNFLFVDTQADSTTLCRFLADAGLLIKGGQGWERSSFIRVSVGNAEQNDRLLALLAAFFNKNSSLTE